MEISPEGRNSRFDQAEEASVNSDIELKKKKMTEARGGNQSVNHVEGQQGRRLEQH